MIIPLWTIQGDRNFYGTPGLFTAWHEKKKEPSYKDTQS